MAFGNNAFEACRSKDTCLTPRIYLTPEASPSTLRQRHQSTGFLMNICCDSHGKTKAPPWRGQPALSNATFLWGAHLDTSDCMACRDAMPHGTQRHALKRQPLHPAQISTWPPAWATGDADTCHTQREAPEEAQGAP